MEGAFVAGVALTTFLATLALVPGGGEGDAWSEGTAISCRARLGRRLEKVSIHYVLKVGEGNITAVEIYSGPLSTAVQGSVAVSPCPKRFPIEWQE